MITVDEIMSASLYTLTESHSIYDAKQLMSERAFAISRLFRVKIWWGLCRKEMCCCSVHALRS